MDQITQKLERVSAFLRRDVWQDPADAGRARLVMLHALRVCLITANSFRNETILLRSSALSYSTLLAVVPVLAIGFSMLKGLGFHGQIEHVLINYLTAEQEELTNRIITYISNTDFKALGAFGTVVLIYAVVMMLSNVERAFNDLWGVTQDRPLVRKISDYISVLILGPMLIVVSTAMITSLSSHTVVQALTKYPVFRDFFILFKTVIPHLGLWIAFTAMYIMMPNTRVRFIPALLAGIICGTVWQIAFNVYTDFNIGLARYNKIYGTFAVLPIFIIWIYISWVIVLIGAQISNAIQHIKTYQQEFREVHASQREKLAMAFYIMHEIACRFHAGQPPAGINEIAAKFAIPTRLVREITDIYVQSGMIQEIDHKEQLQPAKDLDLIRLIDVHDALNNASAHQWRIPPQARKERLEQLLSNFQQAASKPLEEMTIRDIVSRSDQTCGPRQHP